MTLSVKNIESKWMHNKLAITPKNKDFNFMTNINNTNSSTEPSKAGGLQTEREELQHIQNQILRRQTKYNNIIVEGAKIKNEKNNISVLTMKNNKQPVEGILLYLIYNTLLEKARIKHFKVEFIKNWNEKKGFSKNSIPECIAANLEFQSSMITDELKVLIDNSHTLKINFLNAKDVLLYIKAFKLRCWKSSTICLNTKESS